MPSRGTIKERAINLAVWTVIFVIVSYVLNPVIFRDGVPRLVVFSYSILGTLFLLGVIGSWIEISKEIVKRRKKD